jgi:hypothetical protein
LLELKGSLMLPLLFWIDKKDLDKLGEVEDLENVMSTGKPGYGIIKTAEPIDHQTPDWMNNETEIKKFLKEQFPLAVPEESCKRGRRRKSTECSCRACRDLKTSGFWAYIIRRARAGVPYSTIAREWKDQFEPEATEKAILSRIKRAMATRIPNAKAGLRQDGQPKNGKRGRPKQVNDVTSHAGIEEEAVSCLQI